MDRQKFNNYINLIKSMQKEHPELILCGSLALMHGDLLDIRSVSDIDFVTHKEQIPNINLRLSKDYRYQEAEYDGYESYSSYRHNFEVGHYKINVLAHKNDYKIETQIINGITVQNLDNIMKWKTKYNRPKDLKDIDNISNNIIENLITEE